MHTIEQANLAVYEENFRANPVLKAVSHALTDNAVDTICSVSEARNAERFHFSIEAKTLPAANQMSSGRCWLFAGLNVLREKIAEKYNLESFELSQNYTAFWDKFEKINYFLETVIALKDRPTDDRVMTWLLQTGIQDGGQWDMLVNVIEKYGVVPQDAMKETYQSSHTFRMNSLINRRLSIYASEIQRAYRAGESDEQLAERKESMLNEMYGFLCTNFGVPPKSFDFEYTDKDGNYGIVRDLTPLGFLKNEIGVDLTEYVSLINAPTFNKPFGHTYTVDYLGNVCGGYPVCYLNLPMERVKELIIEQLKAGEIVWFGSDVGYDGQRKAGVWDDQAFDYQSAFGMNFDLSKEDGLLYWRSAMNHAMVITGVNLNENGQPNRWKIENSWGDENGKKGYYLMTSSWFDRFVYQAVIRKEYLSDEEKAALESDPIHLDPWDPMGTLAD